MILRLRLVDFATDANGLAGFRRVDEHVDAVEAATQMSLATIHTLVGSKDAMIARAHAGSMERLAGALGQRPPRGRTAEARVRAVMRRLVEGLEQDETRTRTLMRALYSAEPRVAVSRSATAPSFLRMIDIAFGDADVDRASVTQVRGHVVSSLVLMWLNERIDAAGVQARLDRAVSTVLRGA